MTELHSLGLAEKRGIARELLERQRADAAGETLPLPPARLFRTLDMFLESETVEHDEALRFSRWLEEVEDAGLMTFEVPRTSPPLTEVELRRAGGERLRCLNFSAYNYLGYSTHPEVIAAAKGALDRYGLGACSAPVVSGTLDLHQALERALLGFFGLDGRGVSLFSSGYAVNVGAISAYVRAGHHVLIDQAAHMSIVEGAQLSGARTSTFVHNDPESLERALTGLSGRTLVCAEGVYSADGDIGRIADIVEVAKRHGAAVLVDEAHSILLDGPGGRGTAASQGVLDQVDLLVLTFSKGFGAVGGAVVAPAHVARYVNWYARCRMFSCALDPAVTGGVTRALHLAAGADGDARRLRLHANAAYLRSRLAEHVDIGPSESWIIPVIYGSERLTLALTDWLQREGLDTSPMQFPAVARDRARLRLFVTSEHTRDELDRAAAILIAAAGRFGFAQTSRRASRDSVEAGTTK